MTAYDPLGEIVGTDETVYGTWNGIIDSSVPNMILNHWVIWDTPTWEAHDVTTYGPGTYSFDTDGLGTMLSMTVSSVPEPASILLVVSGLTGLVGLRRKK